MGGRFQPGTLGGQAAGEGPVSADGWLPDGVRYCDLPGCSLADEARQEAVDALDERYRKGDFAAEEAEARADAEDEGRVFDADVWAETFLAEELDRDDGEGEDEGPQYERDGEW